MKNRRLTYVLLPLTALIWGLVGYRIWLAVAGEPEADPAGPAAGVTVRGPRRAAGAPPVLNLQYPDPFRAGRATPGGVPPAPVRESFSDAHPVTPARPPALFTSSPPPPPSPAPAPPSVVWPAIGLQGVIENSRNHTRVAMLSIDGTAHLLQEGASSPTGIQVTRIYADSVTVLYQHQRRTLTRS